MTSKPDGGPAFPVTPCDGEYSLGMSLRQYIAIQAMEAYIKNSLVASDTIRKLIAKQSYSMADAMIAEMWK